jgi:hypothetical protein
MIGNIFELILKKIDERGWPRSCSGEYPSNSETAGFTISIVSFWLRQKIKSFEFWNTDEWMLKLESRDFVDDL